MPRTQTPDPNAARARLLGHLSTLGLVGLDADVLDVLIEQAIADKATSDELLERVLGHAARQRIERRIERRIRASGLTEHKTLEAFDFHFQPELDRRDSLCMVGTTVQLGVDPSGCGNSIRSRPPSTPQLPTHPPRLSSSTCARDLGRVAESA